MSTVFMNTPEPLPTADVPAPLPGIVFKALEKYREITHLYPKEIDAHYNIGLASFYLRDYEAAKANFEYAIKFNREKNASNRNTKESLYRNWLADTLVNLKDYQKHSSMTPIG